MDDDAEIIHGVGDQGTAGRRRDLLDGGTSPRGGGVLAVDLGRPSSTR